MPFIVLFLLGAILFPSSVFSCNSDFDCGIGGKCVKDNYKYKGSCAKAVDPYGTPKYSVPDPGSFGTKMPSALRRRPDNTTNMQWQTKADASEKDKLERQLCK